MTPRRLVWSTTEQQSIREMLTLANGPRVSRTLTLEDVRATTEAALGSAAGFAWRHAGLIDDARALTTVCLVGVRADSVTVGVSVVHAKGAVPSWGWADLADWDRGSDEANSARVSAWAARSKENRISLALMPKPAVSSSLEALLEEVKAHPDDDAPRLVYADALTERGDPRGELIVLQCALARLEPSAAERPVLEQKVGELYSANLGRWLEEMPEGVSCHFARGFVDTVHLEGVSDLAPVEARLRGEPVTKMVFGVHGLRAATRSRWIESMQSLAFVSASHALPTEYSQLFDSRVFPRLTSLALYGATIGAREAQIMALMVGQAMSKLSKLVLSQSLMGGSLEFLVSQPWFAALTVLDLSDNDLRRVGIASLTGSVSRIKLRSLMLDGNQLGDEGARAVADAPRFRRLRELSLSRNRIGPEGAESLMGSPHLKDLTRLDLGLNPIGTRARERLAAMLSRRS